MKKAILLFTALVFWGMTACANGTDSKKSENKSFSGEKMNITLSIGTKTFTGTLCENEATLALVKKFPLTLNMIELNGNEYYVYMNGPLPQESKNPHTIKAGDIKLYGSNCLVIFYKSFSTSYSYTELGSIEDAKELLGALKESGGKVTFSLSE